MAALLVSIQWLLFTNTQGGQDLNVFSPGGEG